MEKNNRKIVKEFIECCPDSKYLLNKRGQNILHIAVQMGHKINFLGFDVIKLLGLGQDVDGNTPLHIATKNWFAETVDLLTTDERVLQLRNKSGLRAQDIAETELKPYYIFQQRLTLAYLKYATRGIKGYEKIKSMRRPAEPLADDKERDYVNTFLLVATLVATMTFAAGFTIPGGFTSSNPHLGRAALATNPTLILFLLFDTLALVCSVATIAILIWAQVGDPALLHASIDVVLPLMQYSLLSMPLAFFFGVITAVGQVKWLVAIFSMSAFAFFCWVLFLVAPHVMLKRSNSAAVDYGFLFWLMMVFRRLHLNIPNDEKISRLRLSRTVSTSKQVA
ncbi:hypothetical protein EUTSA_v10002604mg [Eutrema salsugineum]|uniref:PGG domain-containing protein n=2 Tax=Eutrema salsugineum TaxID=72664 RepID=V4KHD3_EUTSA|nr:hypothetical protein EUTSA_v10002604mg [Eutrema salsugineum]